MLRNVIDRKDSHNFMPQNFILRAPSRVSNWAFAALFMPSSSSHRAAPLPLPRSPTPFPRRSCIRRSGPQSQAAPPSIQIGTSLTPLKGQHLPGLP